MIVRDISMKRLIALFSFIISFELFSCMVIKPNFDLLEPKNAKTVLIVEVAETSSESRNNPIAVFRSVSPWAQIWFHVSMNFCTGFSGLVKGDRFVVSTFLSEKELIKDTVDMYNAQIYRLSDLDFANQEMKWMVEKEEFPPGKANVLYGYCKKDDECIQVKNACDENISINKEFKKNYDNFLKKNKNSLSKDCFPKRTTSRALKCVENFCS